MKSFPPEKYYESCITYHLVKEFEERFEKKLYPFSISQIEEKCEGYDYGYTFSNRSFFIQYKRPYSFMCESGIPVYNWNVCREQLSVINRQPHSLKTYYALPAFIDIMKWFEGIDHTYFVLAPRLEEYLVNKGKAKTNIINSNNKILKRWNDILLSHELFQSNVAYEYSQNGITLTDIISIARKLDGETRECTWIYLLEDDTYAY